LGCLSRDFVSVCGGGGQYRFVAYFNTGCVCKVFLRFRGGGVYFRAKRGVCLLLEVLVDHTALEGCRMVTTTKDATDNAGAFLKGALTCQVGTGAFHASWCLVTIIHCVPVSLTVGTLCNVLFFLFGRFKCDFTVL
jgi:hypothetical protein